MRLWCVLKGDNLHVFWLASFNIVIFSDTINVTNVKLCMMILHIELYLFITLSVTLTLFQGHSTEQCQIVLTENCMHVLIQLKLFWIVK